MEPARRRPRVLAEIDPHCEWVRGSEFDTLVVDVTGFTKEQLKVLVEPSGRRLTVSGERAVDGGQWRHFLKRFDLPAGRGDAAAIRVHLDKGALYVQVPRRPEGGEERCAAPAEAREGATMQGQELALAWREEEHPARRLARTLSEHRHAVLNVVLAAVLLWLVAFAKDGASGGHVRRDY